jgi:hypothetical protein
MWMWLWHGFVPPAELPIEHACVPIHAPQLKQTHLFLQQCMHRVKRREPIAGAVAGRRAGKQHDHVACKPPPTSNILG